MRKRAYVSSVRSAAAAQTRGRLLTTAAALLRDSASIADVSLEAVAKAAGVTRLTVYNQFGSRRGLLEAVFDEIARAGGLFRIEEAMALADPRAALDRLVEIFCDFWGRDAAIGRLQEAMASDPEFAQAITARNERRRKTLSALVERIAADDMPPSARRDAVDLMFVLTSYGTYAALKPRRSRKAVCALIKRACTDALDGLHVGFDERPSA